MVSSVTRAKSASRSSGLSMEKFGELDEAKLVSGAGQMLKHVDACYLPKQSYMGSQICCHVLHQVSHMISHNYKYAAISSHQLPHTFLAFASLHQHGSSSGFAASSTLSRHACNLSRALYLDPSMLSRLHDHSFHSRPCFCPGTGRNLGLLCRRRSEL